MEDYATKIDKAYETLEKLSKPKKQTQTLSISKTNIALFAIIGAFVGIILVGGFVFLKMLLADTLETSYQAERELKVSFLGSLPAKRSLLDKWADVINHERVWTDK